jgi:pimeloyl-ACP methyl ester carboxylesterase
MVVRSVELSSGVKLPYVEQGHPAGVPVVLLHGLAGTWRSFESVLHHLPESIHALAMTQRGHGEASKPAEGYRVGDFSADLTGFMDSVELPAAVVVGGSSGGFAARRFAIDHPERTLGLVLLGTPAALWGKPQVEEMWKSTVSKLTDPVDPAFVRRFIEGAVGPTMADGEVEAVLEHAMKVPARVWREANRGLLEDDSLNRLEEIAAPTLIVWGDQDPLSPRSEQERLAARIPDARLVVYPDAGHTFYYEKPARVAADIAAFVRDVVG